MKKVSIIIPVYNIEKYLRKCLDSVVNQTLKDIEIICVNDGSTDSSLQILEEYAAKDSRIKIINRPNGGLSAARNSGLDIVTTEYCYFLDSDDWIELNTIEKLVKIISSNNVDVVIHGVNNILEDSSFIGTSLDIQVWFDSYTKSNGIYDVPMEIKKDICSVTWNKLYKMDIINKYCCRFPEGLVNEDELFLWAYMIHCKNYYYLNDKCYNYLRRSDSIMGTRDNSPKVLDILDIQKEIYEVINKYKDINQYKNILTENYVNVVNVLYQRMPKKYRKEALKKIKLYYKHTNNEKRILKLYRQYKYKKLRQFIQGIFSIKNINSCSYVGKQVTIVGIKFKIKSDQQKKNKLLEQNSQPIQKTNFEIYEYCKNYQYVLDKPTEEKENLSSNYIWQYWGQGEENAPELVKACFESIKKYCPNRNIIVLNDNNVKDYIDIPDFIQEKLEKGIISRTHFSDYLRTCLLVKYGGTWIDATVYLTDKIPEVIENSDFFVFKPIAYSECKKVPSMKMLKLLDRIPTYLSAFLCLSCWFIHSKTNNRILVKMKMFLEEYWKNENELIDYFIYHYFFTFAVLNDSRCKDIFNKMPNIANRNPHMLQQVLLDEYDEELYNELKELSSIHKLTYRKNETNKFTFIDKIMNKGN